MTMAAVMESRAETRAWPETSRIARVDVVSDMREAETVWRALEQSSQFSTPYQRFDFLVAWQRQVGTRDGIRPFIVIARDKERQPLLLLPLGVRRENAVRTARFLGGKHATFNMALWDKDFAVGAARTDIDALMSGIRGHAQADVLALTQQPRRWIDLANPLALLPNQVSANDCPLLTMAPGAPPASRVSNSFRRRLKGKERKLQTLPGYGYRLATSDTDIKRLLDWFFAIKPQRMAAQQLPNVFADPGIEDFIRDACMTRLGGGGHAIDIHALECDEEVIAIFAGVADDKRFSMMFNTYTLSGNSKYSPGLILMRDIIDHYAERGVTSLDLGIGSDDYKRLFCKDDEPIFDSFIPLSLRGKVAAAGLSSLMRAKRLIKHTPALMQIAQRARGVLQR
ncbi:GNAT family N-acetyltransferase [Bradyrhizobium sp.]|jgi:CelD/BcsL family acetyltransferase involved in cellulose biosynthesis|uniref:GNAT family N-acetyltransferase n=1 Tax=Bradyrhizobium sp. TaxID=376 RepID=UPI002DF77AEB|nr:GNAT family N-acetyltransferase [Bradyrhizobium sp.]